MYFLSLRNILFIYMYAYKKITNSVSSNVSIRKEQNNKKKTFNNKNNNKIVYISMD